MQKETKLKALIISLFLIALFFLFFNKVVLIMGNIFFGEVRALYNVTLSQRLYSYSVQPLFGKVEPFANYQLSRIYFIQGNFNKAIYYANKELAFYPENCRAYYIRGLTYGYMNKLDNAIEDFEMFNSTCVKDSWAGHNDLAWLYFRKGDIARMLSTIEPMVKLYETNPWVQNSYGIALLNLGRYKEAREAFEKANIIANLMTEKEWGMAYPGNNPEIYGRGIKDMRATIQKNLNLAKEKLPQKTK